MNITKGATMTSRSERHELSSVSFAGKRRCICGKRVEQDADGKWRHIDRSQT